MATDPAPKDKEKEKKKSEWTKFLWSALDRVFFITMGVVGGVTTAYLTGLLKVNPPELVARPTYSRIDATSPVAKTVGGLALDYQAEAPRSYGVLRLDIANEGRGPAEQVRLQVKLPPAIAVAYEEEPDFKVYRPEVMSLEEGEFYAELPSFPSRASDSLALRVAGDEGLLCGARIKFVTDDVEGEVEGLKGVEACR